MFGCDSDSKMRISGFELQRKLYKTFGKFLSDLKENKGIFLVLSYSKMDENETDLLLLKFKTETPTVFRKPSLRKSEEYEIEAVSENDTTQDFKLPTAFKGTLKYFGIRHYTFNQNYVEVTAYANQPQDMTVENNVTLFQTCKMVMNDAKQIQVEKAIIIFVSTRHMSQSRRIATNLTIYIEATGMHE